MIIQIIDMNYLIQIIEMNYLIQIIVSLHYWILIYVYISMMVLKVTGLFFLLL